MYSIWLLETSTQGLFARDIATTCGKFTLTSFGPSRAHTTHVIISRRAARNY